MTASRRPTLAKTIAGVVGRLRRTRRYPVALAQPRVVMADATAVVTGAAGVLGSALAEALADGGAAVWRLDRRALRADGDERSLRCDLTVPAEVDATADAILSGPFRGGPLLVFQAAGTIGVDAWGIDAAPPSVWADLYATHVVGPVQLVRRLRPAMATAPGSAVVFVGSVNQEAPSPWPHYAASKAAVAKVTEDLAVELAAEGIRVNGVAPARFGPAGSVRPYRFHPLYGVDVPLEAVVNACLFLADPQLSPATTGITLRVDGGLALDHRRLRD